MTASPDSMLWGWNDGWEDGASVAEDAIDGPTVRVGDESVELLTDDTLVDTPMTSLMSSFIMSTVGALQSSVLQMDKSSPFLQGVSNADTDHEDTHQLSPHSCVFSGS